MHPIYTQVCERALLYDVLGIATVATVAIVATVTIVARYPVCLYLDAKTRTYVEEFSTSNFVAISEVRSMTHTD